MACASTPLRPGARSRRSTGICSIRRSSTRTQLSAFRLDDLGSRKTSLMRWPFWRAKPAPMSPAKRSSSTADGSCRDDADGSSRLGADARQPLDLALRTIEGLYFVVGELMRAVDVVNRNPPVEMSSLGEQRRQH